MARDSLARLDLIDFWRIQRGYAGDPCDVRPFHHDIADALTRLVTGQLETPNLMILMPPRCGKTDLGVKAFVPWAHSIAPDAETIISSYAADLAIESTMSIRRTLASDWYRSMIGNGAGARVQMLGEKAAGHMDHFRTLDGGHVKGIGVGGGITGFGAGKLREGFGGLIICDDLLKAQDYRSAAARKAAVDFFEGALKTRRNRKDTPILLIMQRLHPDDPAGHILSTERDRWTVLQVPAHNDNETIWPGRLGMDELLAMREARPEEYWAQYMQEPSESTQTIFKKSWWRYWKNLRDVEARITFKVITADTAFKAKDSADFSSLQCWGFEGISGAYLIDRIKGRWEFPDLLRNAKEFLKKHTDRTTGGTPATEFWIEDKASGQSLVQTMRREGLNVRAWVAAEQRAAEDKIGRANQCTLPISAGRHFLPDPKMPGYQWVEGFVQEHFAFSADGSHLHDDDVDAQTMATLAWLRRGGGRGPIPEWKEAA